MSDYSFSFPVFYACAIKGCTTRKQLDIVQVLLTGKYACDCIEGEKIQESMISGYINGRRKISVQLIYDVSACTHEELVRRFQMINLQNCDKSANRIKSLLESTCPVGETETQRLLEYGLSCSTPLDFLAEAFLAALLCPQGDVTPLSKADQQFLQAGHFISQKEEQSDEISPKKEVPSALSAEGEIALFDYSFSELRIRTEKQRTTIRDRINMFYMGTSDEMATGHPPIIQNGNDEMELLWETLSSTTDGYYYEIKGTNNRVKNTILRLPTINNFRGAILLVDSNPDIIPSDFNGLRAAVASHGDPNCRFIYSLRVSDRTDDKILIYLVLIANPESMTRRPRTMMDRRKLKPREMHT